MSNSNGRPVSIMLGTRYGRLVLLERGKGENAKWLCACDCGNTKLIYANNVRTGKTQSCGCLHAETMREMCTTHGDTVGRIRTPEYEAWSGMSKRCYNVKTKAYSYYGGRGITVCDRWRNSFEDFLADVGRKPTPAHTLDRINSDGNYEPGNVRWATRRVQRINQRRMTTA